MPPHNLDLLTATNHEDTRCGRTCSHSYLQSADHSASRLFGLQMRSSCPSCHATRLAQEISLLTLRPDLRVGLFNSPGQCSPALCPQSASSELLILLWPWPRTTLPAQGMTVARRPLSQSSGKPKHGPCICADRRASRAYSSPCSTPPSSAAVRCMQTPVPVRAAVRISTVCSVLCRNWRSAYRLTAVAVRGSHQAAAGGPSAAAASRR